MSTLELLLQRKIFNTDPVRNIIGELFANREWFCYTLEDELRNDNDKVYGKTCIIADRYEVKLTYSPKFKRIMPEIIGVKNFTGIRMHGGLHEDHTLGCPLIGFNVNADFTRISSSAEKALTEMMKHYDKTFITIENKIWAKGLDKRIL